MSLRLLSDHHHSRCPDHLRREREVTSDGGVQIRRRPVAAGPAAVPPAGRTGRGAILPRGAVLPRDPRAVDAVDGAELDAVQLGQGVDGHVAAVAGHGQRIAVLLRADGEEVVLGRIPLTGRVHLDLDAKPIIDPARDASDAVEPDPVVARGSSSEALPEVRPRSVKRDAIVELLLDQNPFSKQSYGDPNSRSAVHRIRFRN